MYFYPTDRKKYSVVVVSLLSLAPYCPADVAGQYGAASTDAIQAQAVTVTATRTEAEIADVPAAIEVVDRQEIEEAAQNSVADALKYSAGVYMYDDMMRTTPSIRGFEGKHTLILKDGRRYAGPQGKFNDMARFTTESVERIEIVRGPQSTLYGSEAMGGVINIISRSPQETSFTTNGRYGAYSHGDDYYSASFTATFADPSRNDWLGRMGLIFSAQTTQQDMLKVEADGTMLPDNDTVNLDTTLHIKLTDSLSSKIGGTYSENDLGSQIEKSTGSPPTYYLTSSEDEYKSYDIHASLDFKQDAMSGMIRAYYSQYNNDYVARYLEDVGSHSDGDILAGSSSVDEGVRETTTLEAQFSNLFMDLAGDHLVTMGGEIRKEEYESLRVSNDPCGTVNKEDFTGQLGCYEGNTYAMFLQDEWQPAESLLLVPGVRYDHYDQFGDEVSPKFGLTWKALDNLRVKVNYGHSFRAPGVGELYKDSYSKGGRDHIVGDPDLKPETGDGYDLGIEGEIGKFSGRASYFMNQIDDLIDTEYMGVEPSGAYLYEFTNISEAEISGLELSASYAFTNDLLLDANYQYIHAVDTSGDDDSRLAGKPRHLANASLVYLYTPWQLRTSVKAHYVADYGYEVGQGSAITFENDNSFTMSLRVDKDLGKMVTVYAGVDDLFDKYRTYRGANEENGTMEQPGSFYYVGLKFTY